MNSVAEDVEHAATGEQKNNPWVDRLSAWQRFSERFHERGTKIEKRYEDERDSVQEGGSKRINMFYSNTTIIKESLYNSLPKPEVKRLHTGEWDNEPARVAATIMERTLAYEVKCAPNFDQSIKSAILDRLVPGLGTIWVGFEAESVDAEGMPIPEHLTVEMVYWKDFMYEPQRAWEQVTWVGRKMYLTPEVAQERFGPGAVSYTQSSKPKHSTVEDAIKEGKVCVLQIWDKNTRQVHHMTPEGTILDTIDDPFGLSGFFPTPRPLIANPPTRQFLPMTEYYMAQDQYLGMDILYSRINLIVEAIRVSGVYDSSQTSIARMLQGNENRLIPVDNWAMFAERGGVKGHVDWFPVEQVATVLTHLISTYSFIKAELFEVTGMSDIIRGSTNQYETLGAQQLKAQFASVRMDGFQRDVSFFVRDVLRIMADVVCNLYSDDKISATCGILPEADQQFVPAALELLRSNYQSKYSIDIEPDSLTQADWGLEQQQRLEYINSLSQFLHAAVPAAEAAPAIAPLMVQMIKFASVGFKGSNELEGTLDQILDAAMAGGLGGPEEEDNGEQAKQQMEIQKMQMEMQIKQQESQQKLEFKQQEHQMDLQFMQQKHQTELQFQREKLQLEYEKQQARAVQQIQHAENRHMREDAQDRAREGGR